MRGVVVALLAAVVHAKMLHVYMIPHSHCDPGWLESFDGYYNRKVGRILSNVVHELESNRERRFIWAETSFFMKWYSQQPLAVRDSVADLVSRGQLEFVGSGWVQNDEANPHPEAVIDQVTEGHEYLLSLFGVRPRYGWQIDPFGHSSATPAMFASMGYDATVINRIHFNIKRQYKTSKAMEFVWRTDSMGTEATGSASLELFTHVLHTHYSAPQGYDYEERAAKVRDANIHNLANGLVNKLKQRSNAYRTRNLLVPFGDDFKFFNAAVQFNNMDQLIKYINARPDFGIRIQYSTLSEYFDAVRADAIQDSIKFPVYTHDFFPYADNRDSFWTGYYATRPTLKAACRSVFALLRSSEVLFSLARPHAGALGGDYQWRSGFRRLEEARLDLALMLHHDAITGTSRQRVVDDYRSRLSRAADDVQQVHGDMAGLLLSKDAAQLPALTHIPLSVSVPTGRSDTPVVVTNSLGWRREELVEVPIHLPSATKPWPYVRVTNADGVAVPSQLLVSAGTPDGGALTHRVVFVVDMPPLGVTTLFVTVWEKTPEDDASLGAVPKGDLAAVVTAELYGRGATSTKVGNIPMRGGGDSPPEQPRGQTKVGLDKGSVTLETTCLSVSVDLSTGLLTRMSGSGVANPVALSQSMRVYRTSKSGAYLFRAQGAAVPIANTKETVTVVDGPVVKEVNVVGDVWSQRVTLLVPPDASVCRKPGSLYSYAAVVPTVKAGVNEEIVSHMSTDCPVGSTLSGRVQAEPSEVTGRFLTDNGLVLLDRPRPKSTDPIEPSYYPMNTAAVVTRHASGDASEVALMLLNRQPLAVTSRGHDESSRPGSTLEVMMHRSLQRDDGRGLAEGVHDTSVATVPLLLTLQPMAEVGTWWRRASLQHHYPLGLLFPVVTPDTTAVMASSDAWREAFHTKFEPVEAPLPDDLHLLTFKVRDGVSDDTLLRVQSLTTASTALPLGFLTRSVVPDGGRHLPATLGMLRPRTLSMNRPESYLVHERKLYPSDDADSAAEASHTVDKPARAGDGESQNTEEEGVFISQAALDKKAEDQTSPGARRLLSEPDVLGAEAATVWAVAPHGVRSALVVLQAADEVLPPEPTPSGPAAEAAAPAPAPPVEVPEEPTPAPSAPPQAPAPAPMHAPAPAPVHAPEPAAVYAPAPAPVHAPAPPQENPWEEDQDSPVGGEGGVVSRSGGEADSPPPPAADSELPSRGGVMPRTAPAPSVEPKVVVVSEGGGFMSGMLMGVLLMVGVYFGVKYWRQIAAFVQSKWRSPVSPAPRQGKHA